MTSRQDLLKHAEESSLRDNPLEFEVGDTVDVHTRILEGDKERVQIFTGTILALKGRGIRRSITVRRIVQSEGVERIFPLHSPRVIDIQITRRGDVRRSKLYYLRDRVGKKTRVKELLGEKVREGRAAEKARRENQAAQANQAEAVDVDPDTAEA